MSYQNRIVINRGSYRMLLYFFFFNNTTRGGRACLGITIRTDRVTLTACRIGPPKPCRSDPGPARPRLPAGGPHAATPRPPSFDDNNKARCGKLYRNKAFIILDTMMLCKFGIWTILCNIGKRSA